MGDHAQDAINESVDVWGGPASKGRAVAIVQCRYCFTRAVKWYRVEGKWRLHDINGGPHRCAEYIGRGK